MKRHTSLCLLLTAFLFASASVSARPTSIAHHPQPTEEEDSVYLFSYANANGTGGLRFAYSVDGSCWMSLADGYAFLSSDFGSWGSGKKMYHPHVMQSATDGMWHIIFATTRSNQTLAHASSPDLCNWKPQTYFKAEDLSQYAPADALPTEAREINLYGETLEGYVQTVPRHVATNLTIWADHNKYRDRLHAERMSEDAQRFAKLKDLTADITVHPDRAKDISQHFIGIFFEDINYAADGGLYAELVQNRDFEYQPSDNRGNPEWNATHSWTLQGEGTTLTVSTDDPIHENNPHYIVLDVSQPGASLVNTGYDGIVVRQGEKYDLSMFVRSMEGKGGKLKVALLNGQGEELASTTVSVGGTEWKTKKAVLTAKADATDAVLVITPQASGKVAMDMVSLFPRNTFHQRPNGLRADLAQTLADLKPRFVRFPGGCVAHGDGVDNIYDWKGSVGPLHERKPLPNIWRYHQTRGLGYHEYFCFCEDIGAEPLPVLAAGVPCQNSSTAAHHSVDELTAQGQQQGIPMEEMDAYVQDVLDLIEYANGDARTTTWGKKRAENGHAAPFNLKYIGIGNEDLISEVFKVRFRMIYDAVREKYPEITVVGTVGPFYEGSDYDEGWRLASELGIPIVDEHYYVSPGWLIHNGDYYDRYNRNRSKVYLGEYASHISGRANNMETALSLALYLTSVERNADVVEMTSYAPLLAKEGHTQWRPDLIYFNNTDIRLTTDYYVQQMYGQNAGSQYLPSTVAVDSQADGVRQRIGVSVVKDGSDYIVRLANLLPIAVSSTLKIDGLQLPAQSAKAIVLAGQPDDRDAKPQTTTVEVDGESLTYELPAYSFTVIRLSE